MESQLRARKATKKELKMLNLCDKSNEN